MVSAGICLAVLLSLVIFLAVGCLVSYEDQKQSIKIKINGISIPMPIYQKGAQIPLIDAGVLSDNSPVIDIQGLVDAIGSDTGIGLGLTVLDPYFSGDLKSLVESQDKVDLEFLFTSPCMMYCRKDITFNYGTNFPENVHFAPKPLKYKGKYVFAFAYGKSVLFNKRKGADYTPPLYAGAVSFTSLGGFSAFQFDSTLAMPLSKPYEHTDKTLELFQVYNLKSESNHPSISLLNTAQFTSSVMYYVCMKKIVNNQNSNELEQIPVWELTVPATISEFKYAEDIPNSAISVAPVPLSKNTAYVITIAGLNQNHVPVSSSLSFFKLRD